MLMFVLPYLVIVVIAILLSGLRIAQEYQRGVLFRLGRSRGLRGPGLFWIIPLGIERAVIVDIRTRTVSPKPSSKPPRSWPRLRSGWPATRPRSSCGACR